jgi:hypothetical protein
MRSFARFDASSRPRALCSFRLEAVVHSAALRRPARDDVQARRSARGAYPLPQRSERCPSDEPFANSVNADVARRRIPANTKVTAQLTEGKHTLAKPSRQASLRSSARRRRCQRRSLLARLRPGAKRVAGYPSYPIGTCAALGLRCPSNPESPGKDRKFRTSEHCTHFAETAPFPGISLLRAAWR